MNFRNHPHNNNGGHGGNGGSPCGACKFLRRKCVATCIFAPYFDSDEGSSQFASVHKVFGASNVSKLLQHMPVDKRVEAVVSICYEAQARLRDPVMGCVSHIFALQKLVHNLQGELAFLNAHLAAIAFPGPPMSPGPLSFPDLPTGTTNVPAPTYDLPPTFEPMMQPSWAMQQPQRGPMGPMAPTGPTDMRPFGSMMEPGGPSNCSATMGRPELFHGLGSQPMGHFNDPSASSSMSK